MGKKDRKRSRSDSDEDSGSGPDKKRHHKEKHKHKDKKNKKEKKHKKGKSKDRGSSSSDDDMIQQAKKFLKSHLAGAGAGQQGEDKQPPASGQAHLPVQAQPQVLALQPTLPQDKRITEDSYFERNAEFSAWLLEDRRLYFNELTTEQTHELFKEFVAIWNAGRLKPEYYAGLVAAPLRRTTHKWQIKGSSQAGVAAHGTAAFLEDQKGQGQAARAAERLEQKKWRSNQKEVLDELLPKATGREAQIEKRIARREEARQRDASPDAVRLPGGGDIYGEDDSFAAAKAREAKRAEQLRGRQAVRAEAVASAAAALQAKEDERMAGFRALLSQGPIVIQKRQQ